MLPKLHVPMPPRRDVKVPLDLVPLQTPINPARIRRTTQPRRLRKLPPPSRGPKKVMHVLDIVAPGVLSRRRRAAVLPQAVRGPALPLLPRRGVALERLAGEDAVPGSVLHVDVEVHAFHRDDDVEVQLQRVRDALLDAEGVRRGAGPPAQRLGPDQVAACQQQDDGPGAAAAGPGEVGGFGFGCGGGGVSCDGSKGLWFGFLGIFLQYKVPIVVQNVVSHDPRESKTFR